VLSDTEFLEAVIDQGALAPEAVRDLQERQRRLAASEGRAVSLMEVAVLSGRLTVAGAAALEAGRRQQARPRLGKGWLEVDGDWDAPAEAEEPEGDDGPAAHPASRRGRAPKAFVRGGKPEKGRCPKCGARSWREIEVQGEGMGKYLCNRCDQLFDPSTGRAQSPWKFW
jgi:rubredoxin